MANDDSALREVDEALEEERQWAFFQKNGPALIAAGVLLVVGVAGWQIWTHMKTSAAEKQAIEFRDAVTLLEEDPVAGRAALETLGEEKGGYGALANLRRANSYAAAGERLKAVEIYREVAAGGAPERIREFAQLRAALLSLNDGRDAVMSDLDGLQDSDGPFSYYAREILAIASLNEKDYESAVSNFEALAADTTAPAGLRERAGEFGALAKEARAGVNITGEIQVDDLLKTLGAPEAAGDDAADGAVDASGEDAPDAAGTVDAAEGEAAAEDEHGDHDDHNEE